jgi:hypothetical protein
VSFPASSPCVSLPATPQAHLLLVNKANRAYVAADAGKVIYRWREGALFDKKSNLKRKPTSQCRV